MSPRAPLALLALWLVATLGARPLLVPDEGRYAEVAREMLASGDWLVPRLDGLPFFHKPPLMYWLDAAAMALFGANPFGARVASAVGAWLMGAALFLLVRRRQSEAAARLALLMLATSPLYFIGAQYANHDMLVAGLIGAAVCAFAEAATGGSRRVWQLGWVACALALLAKGLIGLVLPLAVVGPWLLVRRRWRAIGAGLHPWSWLPGLVVAAPWFVAMQWRFPQFFDYFIVEQHFRRYTQTSFNNRQPWWFFLAVLPLLTLPWGALAPRALVRALRERGPWVALHGWWVLVIVAFFSLPASKLVGYVLPAVAPWAALIGGALDPARRLPRIAAVLGAALCLAVVAVLAWRSPHSGRAAALALAAERQRGEPVVFMDEMFYDVPFYARLEQPVLVASDWSDPRIATADNWRKELADAARFDPATAARVLWPIERLGDVPCAPPQRVWFVAKAGYRSDAFAPVLGIESVYADRELQLLRAPCR